MIDHVIENKHNRLLDGEPPRVLDLFSGCGGLSLGFVRAGCVSVGGVELDPHASASYGFNFHFDSDHGEVPAKFSSPRNILETDPLRLVAELTDSDSDGGVDILVGGPPCPSFTRVGRAKLREIMQHPQAFKRDPRSRLYLPFIEYVKRLRPLAVVLENVPDFLNWGGHNLGEEVAETLGAFGYVTRYTLLNAAFFGVPQMRDRLFLLSLHESLSSLPIFPEPTHWVDLPTGYLGSRSVAFKHLDSAQMRIDGTSSASFVPPLPPEKSLLPAISVREAIGDLPSIKDHLDGTLRRGARRFDSPIPNSASSTLSGFARMMRTWPEWEGDDDLYDHVIRSLGPRDFRLFRDMECGDDYPKAFQLAERLFEEEVSKQLAEGRKLNEGSAEFEKLRSQFVPPYDPGKFPNKWRKMEPDQPARTLMAHIGKDSYSHIHYDSEQARTISVREAARLQSFPDGFMFSGTMNPAFRQIGNAVPPLLSYAVATELLIALSVSGGRPVDLLEPIAASTA